jgi:histidine triad (HIT) family protein
LINAPARARLPSEAAGLALRSLEERLFFAILDDRALFEGVNLMDCLFCKIIEGAIPSTKVFENERIVAFHDIAPAAPIHILIIPKKHIPTMNDVTDEDGPLMAELLAVARQIAKEQGIDESGYRLVNNVKHDAGQIVYHLHIHLLGGSKLSSLSGEIRS